ncbi:MAG: 2-amino-4-hydroxy-6-hydroxymethyldihydropteridine diphosphokinase [Halioglobus sp.]
MTAVFLGLGSNIERERYLAIGLDALQALFGEMSLSPVYDSSAIGFEGDPFLNMVVGVETTLPLGEMAAALREIEELYGRPANATRFSSRLLDIDILTYGSAVGVLEGIELPREEITENAFVLRPLAELAPGTLHPGLGVSYASLWAQYDQNSQNLKRIDFSWCGKQISSA